MSRPAADLTRERVDTTFYPVREKMGEELPQRLIVEVLRPLVQRWLAEQGRRALVGADQLGPLVQLAGCFRLE